MPFTKTTLDGVWIFEPKLLHDSRGYFFESYNQRIWEQETNLHLNFVQDNQSRSTKGVLRGLHFQTGAGAQAKLVRVVKGAVQDVIVDIRPDSRTLGQYLSVVLSEENNKQLLVPRGFAHGFLVLTDTAEFVYKCDNFYSPKDENGLIFNDQEIKIDWQLPENQIVVSEKDTQLPTLQTLMSQKLNFE